ncbi:hypothetical protein [Rhizosphaericola mali]|uniref:Uncharacterized protein n=1 Tax=Rhizosphaericola mali TaxID=2545455 RepID=A0A5P2G860_9BACT|nr:hypothetical protein [Rhizosphaericola mali]QES90102.1 hypothetical protein E0W69_016070 [Rhizosphaericola mali]
MKIVLLLFTVVTLSSFMLIKKEKTIYYFCTSKIASNKTFLSTEVKSTTEGYNFIKEKINKWSTFIHNKSSNHATSDINYYDDSLKAVNEFNYEQKYYKDSAKFHVETVNF